MTIEELYQWAVKNKCEKYELTVLFPDSYLGGTIERYPSEDNIEGNAVFKEVCIDLIV